MWGHISVPKPILASIDAEYSTHKEKMSALAEYVATIIPNITWEEIADSNNISNSLKGDK